MSCWTTVAWKKNASADESESFAAYLMTGHVEELESHFGPSTDLAILNVGICFDIWSSVHEVQSCRIAPWGKLTSVPCAVRLENRWLFCSHSRDKRNCHPYAPSNWELEVVSGLHYCSSYNHGSASGSDWSPSAFWERTGPRTSAVHCPYGQKFGL